MITKISVLKIAEPVLDSFEENPKTSFIEIHSKVIPSISLKIEVNHQQSYVTISSVKSDSVTPMHSDSALDAKKVKFAITQALIDFEKSLETKFNKLGIVVKG